MSGSDVAEKDKSALVTDTCTLTGHSARVDDVGRVGSPLRVSNYTAGKRTLVSATREVMCAIKEAMGVPTEIHMDDGARHKKMAYFTVQVPDDVQGVRVLC